MVWSVFARTPSAEDYELIVGNPNGFLFNAKVMARETIKGSTRCRIHLDEQHYQVGFKLHSDDRDRTSYARGLFSANRWLKTAISTRTAFEPSWDRIHGMYIIRVAPPFETPVGRDQHVPAEVRGIYRLLSADRSIVYIGRAGAGIERRLADHRLREPEAWDYAQYALVSAQDCERWETHYLNQFEAAHGRLPELNRIRSRRRPASLR